MKRLRNGERVGRWKGGKGRVDAAPRTRRHSRQRENEKGIVLREVNREKKKRTMLSREKEKRVRGGGTRRKRLSLCSNKKYAIVLIRTRLVKKGGPR